ncbi:MAG: PspC domain-containing protein [Candidatus Kapabacteria bacterium]|nr:PspC domain-containing protein [Ignavibacteriota bacterium]MCW5883682.1 PspC domain-containing protein [Candidatus Kapabacteria bacterium]
MTKQLYRSGRNKFIGGVAGGLGEYFDVDPVIIRVIFIVSLFAWGLSLIVYIALWIFVPLSDDIEGVEFSEDVKAEVPEVEKIIYEARQNQRRIIGGSILIAFGMLFLLKRFIPQIDLSYIWPLILVGFGAYIIYKASKKNGGVL